MKEEWQGFKEGLWNESINVENFIQENYHPYDGDASFLKGVSNKSSRVWNKCQELLKEELKKHVLDIDTDHMSGINAFDAGYISEDDDVIVIKDNFGYICHKNEKDISDTIVKVSTNDTLKYKSVDFFLITSLL